MKSRLNRRRFVTMVVDHKNKRLMEVVEGKEGAVLKAALEHIPGRENVRWVALHLSAPRTNELPFGASPRSAEGA